MKQKLEVTFQSTPQVLWYDRGEAAEGSTREQQPEDRGGDAHGTQGLYRGLRPGDGYVDTGDTIPGVIGFSLLPKDFFKQQHWIC